MVLQKGARKQRESLEGNRNEKNSYNQKKKYN